MIKNKTINRVFDDLDAYREFCVDYGYVFDEKDLYRRNTPYGQYERARRGDYTKNNWEVDSRELSSSTRDNAH
jgi:hypothetical protein